MGQIVESNTHLVELRRSETMTLIVLYVQNVLVSQFALRSIIGRLINKIN